MEVNFAGQYTKQDFLQAQKIHYMPSPVVRVLRITAILVVIAIYIASSFSGSLAGLSMNWVFYCQPLSLFMS